MSSDSLLSIWTAIIQQALQHAEASEQSMQRAEALFVAGLGQMASGEVASLRLLQRARDVATPLAELPAAPQTALFALISSLCRWMLSELNDHLARYEVADTALAALAQGIVDSDVEHRTMLLLLRCYVELHDTERIAALREALGMGWHAIGAEPEGALLLQAADELQSSGMLGEAWLNHALAFMHAEIGTIQNDVMRLAALAHYARIVALITGDTRATPSIIEDLLGN